MADELIDIYDENDKPLGIRKMKSEAHRKGLWHRASHIWIYNSGGQMLLQLRAKDKEMDFNKWDIAAAGHAGAGEDPVTTALREVKEELGLSINAGDLKSFGTTDSVGSYGDLIDREHQSDYILRFDGDIRTLKLQKEEVQEVKFFDLDWLVKDLAAHPDRYASHSKEHWLKMIDAVKKTVF